MLAALLGLGLATAGGPAGAAGFQQSYATDADDRPLELAIWYPSDTAPQPVQFGPFAMTVAVGAAIAGERLPLIVLSHGAGGSSLNAYDTAAALADAGFVVAAVLHAGDNYRDQSDSFSQRNFVNRPRQVSRVIDHMLQAWPQHAAIDPGRIGILGHSAGGTTALIAGGGRADWRRVITFCATHPEDWGCRNARQAGGAAALPATGTEIAIAGRDPRVKAAILAAPALSVAFTADGLAAVAVPVQLWISAEDRVVTDAAGLRAKLPGPVDEHLVAHAGHFAFLAPCSDALAAIAPPLCTDPAGFDRAAFLQEFQQSAIAFFRDHLGPAR